MTSAALESASPEVASLEIDLHRVELRFAGARVVDGGAVERLARSIERSGQIVPCIVVGDGAVAGVVLIDGYRRVARCVGLGATRPGGALVVRSGAALMRRAGARAGARVRRHRGSAAAARA